MNTVQRPIRPCRSLCEDVRDGCLPVMSAFGFPWPDMFNCSQFPSDPELCIPATGTISSKESGGHGNKSDLEGTICDACGHANEGEKEIRFNYCKSNFAVKFRVSESSVEGSDRRIVAQVRTQMMLKGRERVEGEALVKSALWLPDGGSCTCEELDDPSSGSFVALGNFEGRRLVLSRLMKWTRTERELRKFIRSLQRLKC
ncbi:hypothetical protein SKAU_G00081180 [Synaphobranchus kaupii]|uniref:NTR domain-containing protein n=1 Tax=Synaphobranchus kaupii TaxID=118154 RepID=A0A9Q1FUV2_SYNKA|nr:hypothetical protein SKAU_G00081180 [Synaphobranchus kaupii]